MSMIARFVEVTSAQLQRILASPSSVTRLFDDQPMLPSIDAMPEASRANFERRVPGMLAGALAHMNPAVQAAITERLGLSMATLQSGAGGDAILKLMREREEANRAPAEGTAASLSLDKAWHGVHYLL